MTVDPVTIACPHCGSAIPIHGLVRGRVGELYACRACGHKAELARDESGGFGLKPTALRPRILRPARARVSHSRVESLADFLM